EVFDHTFHKELDDVFIVDVFPATLDDFRALAQDVAGQPGVRLAWDETFPVLMDADGDGLVSGAFNGPDPDDRNPDTDGDGLSDFYEIQNGFDATEADSDCDGLTDYWEVFYNTDPKHSDADHDGLIDSREVFHPNLRYPYENSVFTNTTAPACAVDAGLTAAYDGGWEIVYAFDGNTPLSLRVSADPNDPDSDDDGLTDRQEEVYGYSPHAPSELDVLTLETSWTMQHPENMPYLSTINTNGGYGNFTYEATVTNDLTGRYLRGLLETEFPVDSVISTREIDILAPAASTTLTGTVNMDDLSITTSQVTSLTLRAGAIVDLPDDHLVWLRMNEIAGDATLTDSSVYGYNAYPSTVTLNGQSAYFPQCNSQVKPGFVDIPADGITVGVWFNMTNVANASNMKILSGGSVGDLLLVNADGAIATPGTAWSTTTTAPGEWHHAALTITGSQTRLYLDGRLQATASGRNLGSSQLFILGSNLCNNSTYRAFHLDDFELFDRVLSDAELLTAYGRESLATSLESTGNGVSCSGDRCPTLNDAGATFDQTQHLAVDTSSLNFSDNQFSIASTVKPVNRAHPFNSAAGAHFGIDTSQDWQGVYGYEDPSNPNLIFPSLYVGSNGALRVKMGDGVNTCTYQTANGIVDFGVEQQVLVSFDGSAFTIFVDGVERATG
ncbi:MAG: laminin G domain-containing protein, partial [Caldilineaceae bacterium]|nr:laminin G domain-containing protein [Caldilineaceae bacterium]